MKKYPYLEITKVGDYQSAFIHLKDDDIPLAIISKDSLAEKLKELQKERKISLFDFYEFMKKAVLAGMITRIEIENEMKIEDVVGEDFADNIHKIELDHILFNKYSELPRIRIAGKEDAIWFFSGPNFYSIPFKTKEEGMNSIKELLMEKDGATSKEIEICAKLLNESEIPGKMYPDNDKSLVN